MYYYLEVTRGIETGRRYKLAEGAVSIGRSSQNLVAMNSSEKSVSGHHAILYCNSGSFMVQDLQSTNGTFLNEEQVTEGQMVVGNTLGFGKMGPRLRLIESQEELTEGQPTPLPSASEDNRSRTVEDVTDSTVPTARTSSDLPDPGDGIFSQDTVDPFAPQSMTMELEKKILENRADFKDMQELMRNSKRMGRLIDRGNLDQAQSTFLKATHHARKETHRRWLYIVGGIVVAATLAVSFFAVRAFQYKQMVDRGLALEDSMDQLERLIAEAQKNPEENRERLQQLVLQLENRNEKLSDVKSQLDGADYGKFYSDPLERKIDEILSRFGESDYHIPPQMVERVRHHVDIYSGRMKRTTAKFLKRREKYFPMIYRIFQEKRLPVELAYVSMLESGFNPMALSHAGARGLWQFMPHTGRRYGLKVNDHVDERCDPEKATYAAAEYFKDLISIFGSKSSVMLAMAGYNAGEGRVMGALRKIDDPMRNRDFWYIYRMGYLAEETNEYIPRIISMIVIAEDPVGYGFEPMVVQGSDEFENGKDDFAAVEGLQRDK